MVLTKELEIKWCPSNKKHFCDLGYEFTNMKDKFIAKFEDIPHSSDKFIDIKCDYCGEKVVKQVKKYYRGRKLVEKDCCNNIKCKKKKSEESNIVKYGVKNFTLTPLYSEKTKEFRLNRKIKAFEDFIRYFKEKEYLMLPTIYKDNATNLPYICKKHFDKGIQYINLCHAKNGRGCYYCGKESMIEKQKFSYVYVKELVESDSKNKLLSKEYTGYNDRNLSISCEECGHPYVTSLGLYLKGKTKCRDCTCSVGEKNIIDYLKMNNIEYDHEYEIETDKWDSPLRFDFRLPDYNLYIEFDGEHHYKPVRFNNRSQEEAEREFKYTLIRDQIKNDYCRSSHFKLLRIPYWERDNISNVLDDYFINGNNQYLLIN